MTSADLLKLLEASTPAIREVVALLIDALQKKDEPATRLATEAALRLAFELRQDVDV